MGGDRIVSLQVLRFVAAAMVVACHAPLAFSGVGSPLARSLGVGAGGVDVFFVLSGFVIAISGPLSARRPSGGLFFWRRWRRVAPIYFLISLPLVVAAWRAGTLSWAKTAATFLFWPTVGRDPSLPYLEPGWTLCFEMVFYTSVALALAGGKVRRNLAIGALMLSALAVARVVAPVAPLRFLVNPIFLEFCAGVALALAYPALRKWSAAVGVVLIIGAAAAFTVEGALHMGALGDEFTVLRGDDLGARLALFGLPAIAAVAGALMCERHCRGRLALLLAAGGDASYAIYLTHLTARDAAMALWRTLSLPTVPSIMIAASGVAAVAVGVAVHRLVEQPILTDLKRARLPFGPRKVQAVQ